jgi:hypothetical protein
MSEECPKCHRPRFVRNEHGWLPSQEDACTLEGTRLCRVSAEAYAKGLAAGVELAKKTARPAPCEKHSAPPVYDGPIEWDRAHCDDCGDEIDWIDTDQALRAEVKP